MSNDILTLQQFYNSKLGRIFETEIAKQIQALWPNTKGEKILGIGYCLPYLIPYYHESERIIYAMPAHQGIMSWPPSEDTNSATLVYENSLPFDGSSFDKILVVHAFEESRTAQQLLKELWRTLKENGRLIIIVPNRHGIWAQSEHTPLGYSHPYTMSQLQSILHRASFTTLNAIHCLYSIPSNNKAGTYLSPALKYIGPLLLTRFSGALCVQATKQVITISRTHAVNPKPSPVATS